MTDARAATAAVWAGLDGRPERLDDLEVTGSEHLLPSSFAIGTAATAAIGAATLAAAELWLGRTGRRTRVAVDARHATVAFRSERAVRVDGGPPGSLWHPIAGFYPASGGRWIQLHTNFPHHLAAALAVVGAPADRERVAEAIARLDAAALETAIVDAGGVAALVRTADEWAAHPQAAAVVATPLVAVERIDDAPSEPLAPGDRPLAGVRVLDLTRVIAGPVAARTLAAHGADVLRVSAVHLPELDAALPDTALGKRSTFLDLRVPADATRLRALVRDADVLVDAYRPGSLGARGFGPADLAALRPGIVHVSVSAYGPAGPWSGRRGYDSLVQSGSGIAHAEAAARGRERPRHLPAQVLDHGAGTLAAAGAMAALARRGREGGSHMVHVSLARTAHWLVGLGRVDDTGVRDPGLDAPADLVETIGSPWGEIAHVRPAGVLADAPPRWERAPSRSGADPPVWATRASPRP